jgi:hypothetical protein
VRRRKAAAAALAVAALAAALAVGCGRETPAPPSPATFELVTTEKVDGAFSVATLRHKRTGACFVLVRGMATSSVAVTETQGRVCE